MTIHIEDLANMDFADVVDPAAEQIPPTHALIVNLLARIPRYNRLVV